MIHNSFKENYNSYIMKNLKSSKIVCVKYIIIDNIKQYFRVRKAQLLVHRFLLLRIYSGG